jgi:uncharacterized protein
MQRPICRTLRRNIMLLRIMLFLNRTAELTRLDRLARSSEGGLAVLSGRRRVGKTRLLLEWTQRHHGLYFVADQSSASLQRRYLAQAMSARVPGFGDVDYPDWRALFARLASEAKLRKFRGPIVLDELPYLILSSPELPSVLQQWIDHDAREAKLIIALAGSSQRMMQGLVLDGAAPLFGRAKEVIELKPLAPHWLPHAFKGLGGFDLLAAWAAWGGVPRYWELAQAARGKLEARIDTLVLDPMGPLHREPDRLLLEETPSAVELRPLLDAIGAGIHRASEIAARAGRPVTSLARPLERLIGLGLVRREVPFGEDPRQTKKSLYRLADPFFRLWFRVVAPQRGLLATATPKQRRELLATHFPSLIANTFEELCLAQVNTLGDWLPASRWWQGSEPEWDVVSTSPDRQKLLLGEAKAWRRPATVEALTAEARRLRARPIPVLAVAKGAADVERMLFVPETAPRVPRVIEGVRVITLEELIAR